MFNELMNHLVDQKTKIEEAYQIRLKEMQQRAADADAMRFG